MSVLPSRSAVRLAEAPVRTKNIPVEGNRGPTKTGLLGPKKRSSKEKSHKNKFVIFYLFENFDFWAFYGPLLVTIVLVAKN